MCSRVKVHFIVLLNALLLAIVYCKSMNESATTISMRKPEVVKRKCILRKGTKQLGSKSNQISENFGKPKSSCDDHNCEDTKDALKSALKMNMKNAVKEASRTPPFLVHEQPKVVNDFGADGSFPVRDEWLDITNRVDEYPSADELSYNTASEMAYLIRERQNDESCKSSVAGCNAYTSMWPQIDGLCDLFFVKCLVEVAGMICRNYTEKDIFKHAPDLCDNVSDFCTQNREAAISFCWTYLYHRYGEVSMNPQPPKTGLNRFIENFI
ncbi:unnamed protein product [Litomosoides sigmodontis]|uniref:Saposin B-type domain-containing protein n=1 Tax=Litomosoides sigmodontis TaxID=42156 RepID=A0A3P6TLZ3_LITSI|nr:unnamed protein product [Litomosoides sigmodontis]